MIFSLELLRDKARPLYKGWIDVIDRMEKVGEHGVRLTFNDKADRELPLLLALLPILPKHATDADNFDKSTLKPLIGSGPYVVDSVKPGEYVSLKRNPGLLGEGHPVEARLRQLRRDPHQLLSATRTPCSRPSRRAKPTSRSKPTPAAGRRGYDFPAATDGRIVKDTFDSGLPSGMYGFVLNTRRDVFKDRDVRAALASLFDFEWANKNLFSGAYQRHQELL